MRLTKIPMPLLIAALVVTSAVVIHLQLTVVHVPPVADSNHTSVLVKGTPYLWRGAASEITISSNATIRLAHMPVFHVIYINGPLSNASLGEGKWMVYLSCGRPILVERVSTTGGTQYLLVKLENVSKVDGLTVLVPRVFGGMETLTPREAQTLSAITGASEAWRVLDIYTNGTHIALVVAPHNRTTNGPTTFYFRLPPAVETKSFKITSSGYGVSYKVGDTTVSAYVMPYQHVVIIPNATARVTIVVK
jgi:hypothetical protein